MSQKVLIANRGEIAVRITQACDELGVESVRVYTTDDTQSLHARTKPSYRISSYRNANDLMEVADHAGCTAVHPGYGFFAEDEWFAMRCTTRPRPLIFIGPRPEVIRDLGNKINVKRVARKLSIPTVPGSAEHIYNVEVAERFARDLMMMDQETSAHAPAILIKAAAGGGGMGIERVGDMKAFRQTYRNVRAYAKRTFGDSGVLIEQQINDFSHIEVQLLGDRHGSVVHLGTRNCSIQSPGHQKRIEMAPGYDPTYKPFFDTRRVLEEITTYSLRLANEVKYDSAGTWEWIVTRSGKPFLMEVNTRLQVENDVSGKTALLRGTRGVNIVKEQIRLALGAPLGYTQKELTFAGVSLELRIIAEDTTRFTPQSGTVSWEYNASMPPWLTIYTHLERGVPYTIPSQYDPNLALLVLSAADLQEAQTRAHQVLDALTLAGTDSDGRPLKTNVEWLSNNLHRLGR